jgi:uncharacterized protein
VTQPPTESRLITLDALRGFAVMGILAMNIIAFSMPEWAYVSPSIYGGETLADRFSWLLSAVFIDGKMRGLFSLLFGASMMLIIQRAESKGEDPAKVHYARMFWLALFGLAHFFLLWFGDILFTYALVGCLAFLFHTWEPRRLIKWALIVYGLGFLLWVVQFGGLQFLQWFATQPNAPADLVQQYHAAISGPEFNPDIAKEIAIHRGAWWGIVADKLADPWEPLSLAVQSFTETLPLMMLGMALLKNGFLSGTCDNADYRHWMRCLLPAGWLLSALSAGFVWYSGFNIIAAFASFMAWTSVPRLMLTLGYAAALILVIRRYADSSWMARVAGAGRAAFTNYLGSSIIMTTIFYGYGIGLYGNFGRAGMWPFVFVAWGVMLLWSKPWLERFHYGPLEFLWRSLSRFQLQPFRR